MRHARSVSDAPRAAPWWRVGTLQGCASGAWRGAYRARPFDRRRGRACDDARGRARDARRGSACGAACGGTLGARARRVPVAEAARGAGPATRGSASAGAARPPPSSGSRDRVRPATASEPCARTRCGPRLRLSASGSPRRSSLRRPVGRPGSRAGAAARGGRRARAPSPGAPSAGRVAAGVSLHSATRTVAGGTQAAPSTRGGGRDHTYRRGVCQCPSPQAISSPGRVASRLPGESARA